MKKFILLVLAAVSAVLAVRKFKSGKNEATTWSDATDSVD